MDKDMDPGPVFMSTWIRNAGRILVAVSRLGPESLLYGGNLNLDINNTALLETAKNHIK